MAGVLAWSVGKRRWLSTELAIRPTSVVYQLNWFNPCQLKIPQKERSDYTQRTLLSMRNLLRELTAVYKWNRDLDCLRDSGDDCCRFVLWCDDSDEKGIQRQATRLQLTAISYNRRRLRPHAAVIQWIVLQRYFLRKCNLHDIVFHSMNSLVN